MKVVDIRKKKKMTAKTYIMKIECDLPFHASNAFH